MKIWAYTDHRDCIVALNTSNMGGNSGWQKTTKLGIDPAADLTDDHGAALYRLVDGVAVKRSEAERQEDWPEEETEAEDDGIDVVQLRADVDYIAMETGVDLE